MNKTNRMKMTSPDVDIDVSDPGLPVHSRIRIIHYQVIDSTVLSVLEALRILFIISNVAGSERSPITAIKFLRSDNSSC